VPASWRLQVILVAGPRDQAEALQQLETVLKHKPYYSPAHLAAGRVLETMGRKAEAETHSRLALQNRLRTPAFFRALGEMCYSKGWLNEAVTNYCDALKFSPTDASTRVNLGMILSQLNRFPEARDCYAEAVRLAPNLPEARVRFGVALGREGKDAEAAEQFAAAVRLNPELIEAHLNLGIALAKARKNAEALAQFQEVLRRSPTNAIALRYVQGLTSDNSK
jgi:tetratricopeptide (TPR) repeat protein